MVNSFCTLPRWSLPIITSGNDSAFNYVNGLISKVDGEYLLLFGTGRWAVPVKRSIYWRKPAKIHSVTSIAQMGLVLNDCTCLVLYHQQHAPQAASNSRDGSPPKSNRGLLGYGLPPISKGRQSSRYHTESGQAACSRFCETSTTSMRISSMMNSTNWLQPN